MRFLDRLLNVNPSIEQKPISEWDSSWIWGNGLGSVGAPVSEREALTLSAVWRAALVRSRTLAALPMHAFKPGTFEAIGPGYRTTALIEKPHPDMPPVVLWTMVWLHVLIHGNAYVWLKRGNGGLVVELWPIHPSRVAVSRNPKTREKEYLIDGTWIADDYQIWHLMGPSIDGTTGMSVLTQAGQALRLGISTDQFAATGFDRGNLAAGVLEVAADIDDDEAKRVQDKWDRARANGSRGSWSTIVLSNGLTYKQLQLPLKDMQLLESRQWTVKDVGRWFGVPPFLMFDTEGSTSWGTGLEQQASGWARFDLTADVVLFEQAFSRLVWPEQAYVKLSLQGLMRGDSAARAEFYNKLSQYGALTINDIRRLEDMSPVPDGDTVLVPVNFQTLERALAGAPQEAA